jgi:hypothetical protein
LEGGELSRLDEQMFIQHEGRKERMMLTVFSQQEGKMFSRWEAGEDYQECGPESYAEHGSDTWQNAHCKEIMLKI